MSAIPLYDGTVGLDTRLDPADIPYNEETGATALAKATNVRITPAGKIERCHGYDDVFTDGAYHSAFCDGGDAFVFKGTSLYRFNTDETKTGVRSGLTGNRCTYAQRGNTTYYSDGTYNGKIEDAVSSVWAKDTYLGPDGNTEQYFGPPVARKLAIFNNRMVMVPDDDPTTIIWSEVGQMGLYRRAISNRRFESEVIMILPVEAGIFVSTHHNIHFCEGLDPHRFQMRTKTNYPAIEWSEATARITGPDLGIETPGQHRLFRSQKGACVALANGELHEMTEKRIDSPTYGQGASVVMGQYYIHSIF